MSLSKTLTLCLVLVQPKKHPDMTKQLLTGTKNQPKKKQENHLYSYCTQNEQLEIIYSHSEGSLCVQGRGHRLFSNLNDIYRA